MKLILTGGFLGSGKTTAITAACRELQAQGKKIAVITNDQGEDQVDSQYVAALGIPYGEVVNGCFCCNYNKFDNQLSDLIALASPDIIFAEAVGSCADLVATVAKPLQKQRPDVEVVIPVFVDTSMLAAVLEERASFISESVRYIFKKQLEEADILILNKKDCVSMDDVKKVIRILELEYPGKVWLVQDSYDRSDILQWITTFMEFKSAQRRSLDIDYEIYGRGEAELSWGDKVITINSPTKDAVSAAKYFIGKVFDKIQNERLTIGHLKFFLQTGDEIEKISFTTMSTSGGVHLKCKDARTVRIVVNARIQTNPVVLELIIQSSLDDMCSRFKCDVQVHGESYFMPGYPTPTYRM